MTAAALRARIEQVAVRRMALPLSGAADRTAELWREEAALWDELLVLDPAGYSRELVYAAQYAHGQAARWGEASGRDRVPVGQAGP